MRIKTVAAVAALSASAASAQWTNCTGSGPFTNCMSSNGAITNCSTVSVMTNCNTTGGWNGNGVSAEPYQSDGGASAADGIANFIGGIKKRKARAKALQAFKTGDCSTALFEAMKTSDLDFAAFIRDTCALRQ